MGIIEEISDEIFKNVNKEGVHVIHDLFGEIDIQLILSELAEIESLYTEKFVEDKLFRKRELHEGRKGDACMVTLSKPTTSPFLNLDNFPALETCLEIYEQSVSKLLNEDMKDSKVLMNWQQYFDGDNSLPMHVDVELIDGEWGKYEISFEEGIIPRYVMVLVTENLNDGNGLMVEIDGEISEVKLHKGDLVLFDNTKMLHGVPEGTKFKRTMLGFRSFETKPLYFKKERFENSVPYKNGNVEGFIEELSTEKAIEKLKENGWYYE